MNYSKLLRAASLFASLASEKESLPTNSKDLRTILKNIEKLETFNARKNYAELNLEHLSSGSSRLVYLTNNKTVIKLAKNDRGIAQNKAEANPEMKSKYLNKILDHAKNYSWIEVRYLDKITTKEFKEITGLDFDDFGESIRYGLKSVSGNTDKDKPKNFDEVKGSEIYKELERIGKKFKLLGGDIARISSWGIKDKHPVLIDAGLTREIFDEFYDDKSTKSKTSSTT